MKKQIKLAGRVYAPDFCEHMYFKATVDMMLFARIQSLAAFIKEQGLYSVNWFEYSCRSFKYPPTGKPDLVTADAEDMDGGSRSAPLRCDVMQLVVCDDRFRWEWQPKHCDVPCLCATDEIMIADAYAALAGVKNG